MISKFGLGGRRKWTAAACAALCVNGAGAAIAQDAESDSSGTQVSQGNADIIVTAQRKEQSLQKVPVTVSAFTSEDLGRLVTTDIGDVVEFVPNVNTFNNANVLGTANAYFIRGTGNSESIATFDPPVSSYVDDILVPRQGSSNISLFEVERVEVLRGPQGTLFGKNTTGGAVNIITKKPEDEFYVSGEIAYGRFNRLELRGTVNTPVTDDLAVMVSGFYVDDDGWITSTVTGDDNYGEDRGWGVRGALRWHLSDTVTWDANVTRVNSIGYIPGTSGPVGLPFPAPIEDTDAGDWRTTTARQQSCRTGANPREWLANNCAWNQVDETAVASSLKIDLGGSNLEFITGYRNTDHRFAVDFLGNRLSQPLSAFAITNDSTHQLFSQEVKLTGTLLDGFFSYTTGVYYLDERNVTDFQDYIAFGGGAPFEIADRLLKNDTRSFAVYSQWDANVTDKLTLTAGLRWTDEEKTLDLEVFGAAGFTENDIPFPDELNTSRFTPKFGIQYQATPDILLFVSATNGFKSGGWNARATNPAAFADFGPEKVWSYELGFKTDLLNDRLRLNATVFHADFTDLQINSALPNTAPPIFVTGNAGDSETTGIEVEMSAVPVDGLRIFGSFGYQDATYTSLSDLALAAGFTLDSSLGSSPDFTGAIGLTYEQELAGTGGQLVFTAVGDYTAEALRAATPTSMALIEEAFIVNSSLMYEDDSGQWSIGIECSNCFNLEQYVTAQPAGTQIDPMRWAIRAKFRM
ncbi:TonB-dependent receptor [uncultured Erythrobacter sp.]|uniref:TonB-dependent receptor n=1 Tax=uncultured Erythrobacter sp. TaxID=263913 RepID=UPI00261C288E|nr:TonB-dependent receptor [uncultured Erythrobacter sp.]